MSEISEPVALNTNKGSLLGRLVSVPSPTTTLVAAAGLLCIGAVMVLSAQSWRQVLEAKDGIHLLSPATLRQVGFVATALITMVLVSRTDYRWFSQPWVGGIRPVTWLLGLSIVLLLLTMAPGIGVEVKGAKRWIWLIPNVIRFQPSELAKIAMVLWLAERFGTGRADARKFFSGLVPAGFILGVVGVLVGYEDAGTAALIGVTSLVILTAAGMHWFYLLFLGVIGAGGMVGLIYMPGKEYRLDRLKTFLDPWKDPQGLGYHPIQSMLAIASGGWLGKGFGAGLQKYGYLPEAHNDFIFALICEEMGFIGATVVIALFAVIIWQGACIVAGSRDDFGRLAAFGIAITVGLQAAMNIAVVTVVAPTKGIALPLVSAGGTSLIVTAAAVGLLASIARQTAVADES